MQLLESPYASGRAVLALTGATQETLNYAQEIMRDEKLRYSLSKDCVIIDKDLAVRSFRFLTDAQRGEVPTFSADTGSEQEVGFILQSWQPSVMLMLLIAVIIILLRIKMYHKKRDED